MIKEKKMIPGPFQYIIPGSLLKKKFYMGIKLDSNLQNIQINQFPGPGSYMITSNFNKKNVRKD